MPFFAASTPGIGSVGGRVITAHRLIHTAKGPKLRSRLVACRPAAAGLARPQTPPCPPEILAWGPAKLNGCGVGGSRRVIPTILGSQLQWPEARQSLYVSSGCPDIQCVRPFCRCLISDLRFITPSRGDSPAPTANRFPPEGDSQREKCGSRQARGSYDRLHRHLRHGV